MLTDCVKHNKMKIPLGGTMENGRSAYIFFPGLAQRRGLRRMTSSRMTK